MTQHFGNLLVTKYIYIYIYTYVFIEYPNIISFAEKTIACVEGIKFTNHFDPSQCHAMSRLRASSAPAPKGLKRPVKVCVPWA